MALILYRLSTKTKDKIKYKNCMKIKFHYRIKYILVTSYNQ